MNTLSQHNISQSNWERSKYMSQVLIFEDMVLKIEDDVASMDEQEKLGIEADWDRLKYYILLDELF